MNSLIVACLALDATLMCKTTFYLFTQSAPVDQTKIINIDLFNLTTCNCAAVACDRSGWQLLNPLSCKLNKVNVTTPFPPTKSVRHTHTHIGLTPFAQHTNVNGCSFECFISSSKTRHIYSVGHRVMLPLINWQQLSSQRLCSHLFFFVPFEIESIRMDTISHVEATFGPDTKGYSLSLICSWVMGCSRWHRWPLINLSIFMKSQPKPQINLLRSTPALPSWIGRNYAKIRIRDGLFFNI